MIENSKKTNIQLFKELKLRSVDCTEETAKQQFGETKVVDSSDIFINAPNTGFEINQLAGLGMIGLSLLMIFVAFGKK